MKSKQTFEKNNDNSWSNLKVGEQTTFCELIEAIDEREDLKDHWFISQVIDSARKALEESHYNQVVINKLNMKIIGKYEKSIEKFNNIIAGNEEAQQAEQQVSATLKKKQEKDLKEIKEDINATRELSDLATEKAKELENESQKLKNYVQKIKEARSKGGKQSPYKEHEIEILKVFHEYRKSNDTFSKEKLTLNDLPAKIKFAIGMDVTDSVVKDWWGKYRISSGKTIFTLRE